MEPIERRASRAVILCPEKRWLRRAIIAGLLSSACAVRPVFADNWRITPSIGAQEIYDTNTQGAGVSSQPDLVTAITPSIAITGDTARSQINFNYAPVFNYYDLGTNPSRVDQNLNATGKIVPFLDYLSIDLTAYATQSGSTPNSFTGQTGALIPGDNLLLYYVGKVAPHFTAHYKDVATFDAYYRITSTNTSDEGSLNGVPTHQSNDSLGQEAQVIAGSANSLGKLNATLNFDHSFNSGTGENNNATNDADFLQLQYRINRDYSLIGSIGYQKTHYDATNLVAGYTNEGMTWNTSVRLTPNNIDSITLGYGLQQGTYSPTMQAQFTLGQRTLVSASYIVTVQNQLQSTLQNLQFLTYNQAGQPIDSRTGLPYVGVNSIFGSQNVLFRDKPLLVTVSQQFVRSTASLSLSYDTRSSVSGLAAQDTAWGISVSYSRDLTPIIQATANFGFTDHVSSGAIATGAEHAQIYNAGFSLTYTLNENTSMTLSDYYFNEISDIPANSSMTNQLLIGLRRGF
jgi:uncharacterized protein (PEP-CTERM system associated)